MLNYDELVITLQHIVTHLDYSVPRNTAVVGAVVTRSNLRLPADIKFTDFLGRVCAQMDLDPAEAELGYKFSSDRVGDVPRTLANEQDLVIAIEDGQGLVRRARTRKIEIMIHNLVCIDDFRVYYPHAQWSTHIRNQLQYLLVSRIRKNEKS